uniref:Serine/threonine-protein phosphatase 4 regulatory subunit 1-like n=1 Tax=Callorhinchus milii TaxID=7868 RepID=A0A4W3JCG9_CALMI
MIVADSSLFFGFDDYGSDCDGIRITAFLDLANQDEMTPLSRLEKYAASDNVFNRQIVARGLLDVLRAFSDDEKDFLAVMETVVRLSEDTEPTVRAELMEQVPHIAMFLQENRPSFPTAFSKYLVPIVVRYLTDPNNQVRKTSQAALLVLLEQELIDSTDVETKVCPILLDLTAPDGDDDYKIEAVAIICKMASMLSGEITERLLLLRFCELCSDGKLFHVRKVCATNFGDICNSVGQEATENHMIPRFFQLCSDSVWGIRKACAECFMSVSCSVSPEIRRTKLSPLFINLISDPSRWVRQAAFQSLGPFISTFANPSSAGLYIKEDAKSLFYSKTILEAKANPRFLFSITIDSSVHPLTPHPSAPQMLSARRSWTSSSEVEGIHSADHVSDLSTGTISVSSDPETMAFTAAKSSYLSSNRASGLSLGSTNAADIFNSFVYWRTPLPDINFDLELHHAAVEDRRDQTIYSRAGTRSEGFTTSSDLERVLESLQAHLDDPDVQGRLGILAEELSASNILTQPEIAQLIASTDGPDCISNDVPESLDPAAEVTLEAGKHSECLELNVDEHNMVRLDVIPQPLLDQYLSMTDPSRAQTVDTEITKHCAYSLPGVALTLGRQNWHCLKNTYEMLASDVQWKVRRTLAFSIHELAAILGDQLTAADLVPIFNGFLKDLDEVRIGVLKHLYDFLKLLPVDKRREYLFQLQEFMVMDNSRNWRFRYELAEQLILLLELYSPNDVCDYLRHIALTLCSDKVAEVRWISFKLVRVRHIANSLALNFMNELTVRFCHCPKWIGRQAFAFICQAIVEEECVPVDQFIEHLLPSLLSLSTDPVPNVRVLLAKALRHTLLEKAYFTGVENAHVEAVEETVLILQSDRDRDVRFFSSTEIRNNPLNTTSSFIN